MSEGDRHHVGVMIKNVTTLGWHVEPICKPQLRRVPLSNALKRRIHFQEPKFEDGRILTGINFGENTSKNVKTTLSVPLNVKFSHSKNPQEMDSEPVWVSVLGSVGLALGILTIWILA